MAAEAARSDINKRFRESTTGPTHGRTSGAGDGEATEVAGGDGRASDQRNAAGDTTSDTPDRPARGRFGAPVPRAPDEDVEKYAVDFDIGGGRFATITLEFIDKDKR